MIGPGCLPRPFARFRKRTLAYTRPRRSASQRKVRPPIAEAVHHEIVLFDRGPVVFPVATLVPHDTATHARVAVGGLRRWLSTRWLWLRPRMIPVVASALGTLMVIASAEYLTHAHGQPIRGHGHASCSISHR